MSGEAEKDKIWALQRHAKDRSTCDQTIYTDGSATMGTVMAAGGILLTAGLPFNPTNFQSYAIPPGTWCASLQAEMMAIKKALHIIQTEESPLRVQIVSDSQSVLHRIANLRLAIPLKSADESDYASLHAGLRDEGHRITLTWCSSHCEVVVNFVADEQAGN